MSRPTDSDDRTPGGPTPVFNLHVGDARDLGSLFTELGLPDVPFVTTTITSPPYGGLKDYGGGTQLGWQQDYEEYLSDCGLTFQAAFDMTVPAGSLWLVADTLSQRTNDDLWRMQPLPFQLAERAEKAGWILRETIIWRKDRTLPWSPRGRLRNGFEYVLYFVKSKSFKYHVDRLREPIATKEWWVRFPERYNPLGAVPSNVWDIPIPKQGAWGQDGPRHSCPLPPTLVDRLIALSTDPGDVVLDPFAGTGIVLERAEASGRRPLGFDTNARYVDAFKLRARSGDQPGGEPLTFLASARKVRSLRALKYARVLYERQLLATKTRPEPVATALVAVVLANIKESDDLSNSRELVKGRLFYVVDSGTTKAARERLRLALREQVTRRPASKFGVAMDIDVMDLESMLAATTRRRLHLYPNGRFWQHAGAVSVATAVRNLRTTPTKRLSILSNLAMSEIARELPK